MLLRYMIVMKVKLAAKCLVYSQNSLISVSVSLIVTLSCWFSLIFCLCLLLPLQDDREEDVNVKHLHNTNKTSESPSHQVCGICVTIYGY